MAVMDELLSLIKYRALNAACVFIISHTISTRWSERWSIFRLSSLISTRDDIKKRDVFNYWIAFYNQKK